MIFFIFWKEMEPIELFALVSMFLDFLMFFNKTTREINVLLPSFSCISCVLARAFRPHLASNKIGSCEENLQAWAWKSKGFGGLKGSLWAWF